MLKKVNLIMPKHWLRRQPKNKQLRTAKLPMLRNKKKQSRRPVSIKRWLLKVVLR